MKSAPPVGKARTIALISLFMASFMELLDATIVNVALPDIERALGAQNAELQWMVASYTLALAIGWSVPGLVDTDGFARVPDCRRLLLWVPLAGALPKNTSLTR